VQGTPTGISAGGTVGGVRTYAHLGDRAFTDENWMTAVRAGTTFVTVGPLIAFAVNGQPAGSRLTLPASGGTVDVTWTVESVRVPIEQVEIVLGGLVAEQVHTGGTLATSGSASVRVTGSTWIALRVRGSLRGRSGDIAAHTSAVKIIVGDSPVFAQPDAVAVLAQIGRVLACVDTIAPCPSASGRASSFKIARRTMAGEVTSCSVHDPDAPQPSLIEGDGAKRSELD
jgi:hypothetical protein